MRQVYLRVEEKGKITALFYEKADTLTEISVEDDFDDISIFDYKVSEGALVRLTNEEKEEFYPISLAEKQESILKEMMAESAITTFLLALPDAKAVTIPYCYPSWQSYIGGKLKKDVRVEYDGALWKTRQEIQTVLKNQFPSIDTAALYERIDVEHVGTLEDPIPYANTMEVFKGKYYLEDGIIYLCLEDSGQPLYASCKDLPRYFVVSPRMA